VAGGEVKLANHIHVSQRFNILVDGRFDVLMTVTMKNVVFCDIKPSSYLTGDTLRIHYRAQPLNAM
jgi:hypothetical protein